MDIDQLKQLLELVREHELAEFEIEHDGLRLKVRKEGVSHVVTIPAAAPMPMPMVVPSVMPAQAGAPAAAPAAPPRADVEADNEFAIVKSPIVGTFYRAPEPGAPPFVEVGGSVKKGQVLCIIEAMKLMNEIDSEYDGEIVNVYVENGQAVQYGERLFAIRSK